MLFWSALTMWFIFIISNTHIYGTVNSLRSSIHITSSLSCVFNLMWVISYQYVFKICHFDIVEPLIVVLSLSIKTTDSNAYLAQTCVCLKYENSTIVTFNEIALLYYCQSTIWHKDNEQNITNNHVSFNSW